MAKVCRECAKKDDKVYLKRIRKTFTLSVYKCGKCGKVEVIERK